jgi:hypothetical protein
MDNTILYVDLDATLVHNTDDSSIPTAWRSTHSGNIFLHQSRYIIRRPFCIEFLKKLNDLVSGNVYILTAGETEYQTNICNVCGITPLVKGIYGYQNVSIPVNAEHRALIDNDASMSLNTVHKIMKMGFYPYGDSIRNYDINKVAALLRNHIVPISDFNPNLADTELISLIPKINKHLLRMWAKPKTSYSSKIRKYF